MAVTVRGLPAVGRVEVTGNVEATLELPSAGPCLFYLAFSDGTLIEGRHEDRINRFRLHTEGAGLTAIRRDGDNDVLDLRWAIEWVTIASLEGSAYPVADQEPLPMLPGLFEGRGGRVPEAAL
ncbi:hypothetical protein SH591_00580 [Sphingomonas sp. LY54]|uniref:hypothetical protein n=1 Tax=Sphingomonas sp. LY54 TaxID=3095343 RepID=UPI002D785A9E|nr:hypothetical protein [Sphingomonas sp. LY54]WRP28719.1 hypothetical protein SH591_00580 [Sphingomonas sp. LY54]